MKISNIAELLGGEKVLRKRVSNRMDLIELGANGVTKRAIEHLADHFSITVSQIARFLPVSERTIQRYASNQPFKRDVSEQIIQIAEIFAAGLEVFEDKNRFMVWMNNPVRALADKSPMSLLSSRFGAGLVMDELGRIKHGVIP
jgi:putative toxin-antitoxin system antitoxin component (TIGR02293 family)